MVPFRGHGRWAHGRRNSDTRLGFQSISITGRAEQALRKSATLLWDAHADHRIQIRS
jgi:hypothetical protein